MVVKIINEVHLIEESHSETVTLNDTYTSKYYYLSHSNK